MVYLFLDIDGVCHPTSAAGRYFRRENMQPLEEALDGLPVKIVISSTWREDKTLNELRELFGVIGNHVVGVTPIIDDPFLKAPRHKEVALYLESNNASESEWIAVDDTPAFYQKNAPLVLTNGQKGFTQNDGALLKSLLCRKN